MSVCELLWSGASASAEDRKALLIALRPSEASTILWEPPPPSASAAAAAAISPPEMGTGDDLAASGRGSQRAPVADMGMGAMVDMGLGSAEGVSGDAYMAELIAAEDIPSAGLPSVEVSWHADGGRPSPLQLFASEWVALTSFANVEVTPQPPPANVGGSGAVGGGGVGGSDAGAADGAGNGGGGCGVSSPSASPSASSPTSPASPAFARHRVERQSHLVAEEAVQAWVLGVGADGLPYHESASAGIAVAGSHAAARSAASGLVAYLSEQLLLAAALCEGRNYACLAALQPLYPFKLLLATLSLAHPSNKSAALDDGGRGRSSSSSSSSSSTLSDALYAACGTLLHRLWLDRAPQEPLQLPQLVRAWSALTAPPIPPTRPHALQLLLDLVLWLLKAQPAAGGASPPAPLLCAALLRMMQAFVCYGFCASAEHVSTAGRDSKSRTASLPISIASSPHALACGPVEPSALLTRVPSPLPTTLICSLATSGAFAARAHQCHALYRRPL